MCKDPAKGEYLRADHLVENVLKARLKGDKLGRGVASTDGEGAEEDPKKAKTKIKDVKAVKLDDVTVGEYEGILAKVTSDTMSCSRKCQTKEKHQQIDNYDGDGLAHLIEHLDIRNPDGNGQVLPPVSFNLMFKSRIGPSTAAPVYLRPETAQGQFINFRKLLEYNNNVMPFASASVGKSYRNEISPRSGLLRVREFLMAEIEHFVDPGGGKKHERFDEVQNIELALLNRDTQLAGQTTIQHLSIGKAVEEKTINNETLGYFLGRVHLFLMKINVEKSRLRFCQHLANEMAHYACDCWDAELLTSYGWVECVGCADRSAYDLTVHATRTGQRLTVKETRQEPLKVERWVAKLDKKKLGPKFRKDAKAIENAVEALDQVNLELQSLRLEKDGGITIPVPDLASGDGTASIPRDLLHIEHVTVIETTREYVPNVIEPSFGIGRILYCLLEQVYWHRPQDVARGVSPAWKQAVNMESLLLKTTY